jgi:hypothetical protein
MLAAAAAAAMMRHRHHIPVVLATQDPAERFYFLCKSVRRALLKNK